MRHATARRRATAILTTAIVMGALGVAAPAAVLAVPVGVEPSGGLDFGQLTVGETSAPQSFTFTGVDPAGNFVSVGFDYGDNDDFAVASNDCPALGLQPGDTCTVEVTFTPHAQGDRSAFLVVNAQSSEVQSFRLRGEGIGASSGVAWGASSNAGPAYTWNGGGALGRTVQSGTQHLHLAYATDRINGTWASDTGKHAGIYYVRSVSGATWSSPKRLNPSTQHALRLGLAASGARVYVAWVSQTKIVHYSPTAPRVLYVRVNTNHGASTAWKPTIRLTSTSGRVDYPTVAAAGSDAYVSWTDSITGKVRVAVSHDGGAHWGTVNLGSTTTTIPSGRMGLPSVAAGGGTAVVAWGSNPGTIKARVSTDHGRTWGTTVTVSTDSLGYASAAVRGDRIAIVWSTGTDLAVRERVGDTWQAAVVVASHHPLASTSITAQDTTVATPRIYGSAVALQDDGGVAVAWTEQTSITNRWSLRWAESTDDGAHWYQQQTVGSSSSSLTRVNDWPSILWTSATTRLVVWNGWTQNTNNYRLYLRTGTGTPAGAVTAASPWRPQAQPAAVDPRADRARGPR